MSVNHLIRQRFGLPYTTGAGINDNKTLNDILNRRSHRRFTSDPVPDDLLQTLFACAFSAPSKSDLQQGCVIHIRDSDKQRRISSLSADLSWTAQAPVFLIWCGDSRRIRRLAEWRKHPFANDHLDAFMNAAVDAGIVMQTFIIAAESVGLGCCPVSQVRDHIDALSAELSLPRWVFPVAGLGVGWPASEGRISLRLPLSVTVHQDQFDDDDLIEKISDYDRRREALEQTAPEKQRMVGRFGVSNDYGWSENRTRQYTISARENFGRYIRDQGFNLS